MPGAVSVTTITITKLKSLEERWDVKTLFTLCPSDNFYIWYLLILARFIQCDISIVIKIFLLNHP